MSELLNAKVNDDSGTACTPLSNTHFYNEPLNDNSIDDPRSIHLGCDPLNVRGLACKHSQSESGCNSISLNVGNEIVGKEPMHQPYSPAICAVADKSPGDEFE